MKKLGITLWIIGALLLLPGASVWEGAAAISPNGELPEGFYAATNSFPRNTVVEITNLETGKTIRVIVAAGLDSPGLLATLSRNAAEAIGLQSRSIGRIRMTQPQDPIAFSRFIEGLGSSGDPDYDPRARIADTLGEKSGAPAEEFVDIPDSPPRTAGSWEDAWAGAPGAAIPGGGGTVPVLPGDTAPGGPAPAVSGSTPPAPPVYVPETYFPPATAEGMSPGTSPGSAGVRIPQDVEAIAGPVPERDRGSYDLTLVPAEERPPEAYPYGEIPREPVIPLPEAVMGNHIPQGGVPGRTEGIIDPRYIIDPIPGPAADAAPASPVPEGPFVSPAGEAAPDPALSMSVPVISRLEQGKYYLQLGAFNKPDAVESELAKIERIYPLAVQNGGNAEHPVYRILVGPVTLGESGALLQRFKGSGYKDAFIRQGD